MSFLVLSTMHVIIDIQYLREGFISSPLGPAVYFALVSTPIKVAERATEITAISLADALTIYRLYFVWNRKKSVIIVPVITLLATIACAIAYLIIVEILSKPGPGATIFTLSAEVWLSVFLACSLATSCYCTACIAWKLLEVRRATKIVSWATASERWTRLLRIFVESAALYSGLSLIYMVLYLCKMVIESLPSAYEVPVASITFSLIILRVETLGHSDDFDSLPRVSAGPPPPPAFVVRQGVAHAPRHVISIESRSDFEKGMESVGSEAV